MMVLGVVSNDDLDVVLQGSRQSLKIDVHGFSELLEMVFMPWMDEVRMGRLQKPQEASASAH